MLMAGNMLCICNLLHIWRPQSQSTLEWSPVVYKENWWGETTPQLFGIIKPKPPSASKYLSTKVLVDHFKGPNISMPAACLQHSELGRFLGVLGSKSSTRQCQQFSKWSAFATLQDNLYKIPCYLTESGTIPFFKPEIHRYTGTFGGWIF